VSNQTAVSNDDYYHCHKHAIYYQFITGCSMFDCPECRATYQRSTLKPLRKFWEGWMTDAQYCRYLEYTACPEWYNSAPPQTEKSRSMTAIVWGGAALLVVLALLIWMWW